MAANIFNKTDYEGIKNRINRLNEESQRQWGKMTLPQMLEHCSIQLKRALGIIPETAYEGPSLFQNCFRALVVVLCNALAARCNDTVPNEYVNQRFTRCSYSRFKKGPFGVAGKSTGARAF